MGFVDDILADLGLGGASLEHIQTASATVKPEAMDAMADLYDMGSSISGEGSSRLNTAISQVVAGWKGQAADAASTKVLTTSRTSDELGNTSTTAAQNTREYASTVRGLQSKIAAVQPIDTSFGAALKAAGGPASVILNPGGVGQHMLAAQLKADQHRDQAAGYLNEMNSHSDDYSARQRAIYPPAAPVKIDRDPPATLSVAAVGPGPGGGGSNSHVRPVTSGSGAGSSVSAGGGRRGSAGLAGFRDPSDVGSTTGRPTQRHPVSGAPVHGAPVVADPNDGTHLANFNSPLGGGTVASHPAVASPAPVEGGTNVGLLGGLAAGGGALAAAGGLAGGRGAAFAGGRGGGLAGESGGSSASGRGAGNAESFERTGRGAVAEGDARPGTGGAAEPALRPGALSSGAAGEGAAGNRGFLPGGGAGARGSGDDDGELKSRPDYLVETDDLWGDGRLAAPPVLG